MQIRNKVINSGHYSTNRRVPLWYWILGALPEYARMPYNDIYKSMLMFFWSVGYGYHASC